MTKTIHIETVKRTYKELIIFQGNKALDITAIVLCIFTHCNLVTRKTINLKSKEKSFKSRNSYLMFIRLCLGTCIIVLS